MHCLGILLLVTELVLTYPEIITYKIRPSKYSQRRANETGRIVNGELTFIANHPHQVAILRYSNLICGGSIISVLWILSAAHCLEGMYATSLSVRAGSNSHRYGGTLVKVKKIINHSKYDSLTMINDIGLLLLENSLYISSRIKAARLPYNYENIPTSKQYVTITGWGVTAEFSNIPSPYLKEITVPVISRPFCNRYYKKYSNQEVLSGMFCAGLTQGQMDSCQGDSGGPASIGNKVVGIVSFGFGCARPFYPGIYTQVSKYRPWIKSITGI